jgi:hypothetical protein
MYRSRYFCTWVLDEGEWSTSRPGSCNPRVTTHTYPLDMRLDDMESRKFLTIPGLELRPLGLQPVAYVMYAKPFTLLYVVAQSV